MGKGSDLCPHCGENLAYEDQGKKYSDKIGVEIRGVYDGVLYWTCLYCEKAWPRPFLSTHLHLKSKQYADQHNAQNKNTPA